MSRDAKSKYLMTGIVGCCARAASGYAAAPPPITLMKSRRLMAASRLRNRHRTNLQLCSERAKAGGELMSALGHKQTCAVQIAMSAMGQ